MRNVGLATVHLSPPAFAAHPRAAPRDGQRVMHGPHRSYGFVLGHPTASLMTGTRSKASASMRCRPAIWWYEHTSSKPRPAPADGDGAAHGSIRFP